jgi:hypothetical protein
MSFSFSPLDNWNEVEVDGQPHWMRAERTNSNYLKLSLNQNMSGKRLEPPLDLVGVSTHLVGRMEASGRGSTTGQCRVGRYTKTVFESSRLAYGELWVLTDEYSVGIATFCCDEPPTAEELDEVAQMVTSMTWPNASGERAR